LSADSNQRIFHDFRLSPIDEYLSQYPEELKSSTYSDGECEVNCAFVDSVLFRVLAGFFGGFFLALYGVFVYYERRLLGASLIGLGTLSACAALAYMILTSDYGRFTACQSDNERESQVFPHNAGIVWH
jgi:hypothetical protein